MHLRKTILALVVGDANRLHHSVREVEREQVLVLHRWSNQGEMALLLFGFNQSPVRLNLCAPVGAWQLRLDFWTVEFGGTGKEAMPQELTIRAQGTLVTIPAYAAVAYVSLEHRKSSYSKT